MSDKGGVVQSNISLNYGVGATSELDKYKVGVSMYALAYNLRNKKRVITDMMIDILSFYLLYGYNKETKKMIVETLNISIESLHNMNHKLTKIGCLKFSVSNYRKKVLNRDLLILGGYLRYDKIKDKSVTFYISEGK